MSGSWANPNTPNLADFTSFVYGSGVPVSALPTDSPWISYAFKRALDLTPAYPTVAGLEYTVATYNCGLHFLIEIAPDQNAVATGSFDSGTMSVTDVGSGTILPSQVIQGLTAGEAPLTVMSYGTGTGGNGDYAVSLDSTISSATFTLAGTYFAKLRGPAPGGFALNSLIPGVVVAAGDQGTSGSFVVPESLKNLTVNDLQFLQTPYGRNFIGYCQDFGPLWGLS